jgi:DNA polymerase elongation subunit (family B)
MIKLKIKTPGYTVSIPGIKPCRSPVVVDISKLDIRVVTMYLNSAGIKDYEIIATSEQGVSEVYTSDDFDIKDIKNKKDINKRLKKIEKIISKLIQKGTRNKSLEKEQINDKLETLETLTRKILENRPDVYIEKTTSKEPVVEEFDYFIPDIDTSGMKFKPSKAKSVSRDSDLEDTAERLSSIRGGKKND